MADPKVIATVEGVDHLSPLLAKLEANSRNFSTAHSRAHEAMVQRSLTSTRAMERHFETMGTRVVGHFRTMAADAGLAIGGFAVAGVREALRVGEAMESTSRKILAFSNISREQLAAFRKEADTTASRFPHGPQGFMEGVLAAGTSGVAPAAAGIASRWGNLYSTETGEDPKTATEHIIGHGALLGEIRDSLDKIIPASRATPEQLEAGLHRATNLLMAQNRLSPGSLPNLYDAARYFGPSLVSMKVPSEVGFAMTGALAERGIVGEEAGNAIRSMVGRLIAPTAKARSAMKAAGLDYGSFVELNTASMNPTAIKKSLELRAGTLNSTTQASVDKALDRFRTSKDFDDLQTSLTDALLKSGAKSMKNRVTAANLARDTSAGFLSGFDVVKFFEEMDRRNLGVGFKNQLFGVEQGGRAEILHGANLPSRIQRLEDEEAKDPATIAKREMMESYTGAKANLTGSFQGMLDRLFQPMAGPLAFTYNELAQGMQAVSNASDGTRQAIVGLSSAAAALATYNIYGRVRAFTSALTGAARGVEAAAHVMPAAVHAVGTGIAATAHATSTAADRLSALEATEQVAKNRVERAASVLDKALERAGIAMEREAKYIDLAAQIVEPHLKDLKDDRLARAAAERPTAEAAGHGIGAAANVLDVKSAALDAAKAATKDGAFAAQIEALTAKIAAPIISRSALLSGAVTALKVADVATWPLVLRDLGESRRPTTPLNFAYKNDVVTDDWREHWARSEASRRYWQGEDTFAGHMGGPEAARGEAWHQRSGMAFDTHGERTNVPVSVDVKGEVSGQAEVHQTMSIEVQPTPYFMALIKQAESMTKMAIGGSVGTTMTGSNGTARPAVSAGGIGHI